MCHACLLFVYLLFLLFTHRKLEESESDVEGDSLPVLLHNTTGQDVSGMDSSLHEEHFTSTLC